VLSVFIGLTPVVLVSRDRRLRAGLMPHRVGAISGLFFGFAFGLSGIGAAGLGWLADYTSIGFVYLICSFFRRLGCLRSSCPI
jgi:FSR family fosmidomycin resistance protein-like MFS transporter